MPFTFLCFFLLLLYHFQFYLFWKKLSFERKLVKTSSPCPVLLHMDEFTEKKPRRDIYPHTTVRFMERLTREIFLWGPFYFFHLVFLEIKYIVFLLLFQKMLSQALFQGFKRPFFPENAYKTACYLRFSYDLVDFFLVPCEGWTSEEIRIRR